MNIKITPGQKLLIQCVLLIWAPSGAFADGNTDELLTLTEAERIALDLDPVTKNFVASSEGFEEQVIADGQLPDPQLKLGINNLPVGAFDLAQGSMTQLQLWVMQAIPPGETLRYRRERTQAFSEVERARSLEQTLDVLREVRMHYVQLYYQTAAENILQQNRSLFSNLLDITLRHTAAGRDNQHDVLRAQLELSLVDDRILEVMQEKEAAIAELGKFIRPAEAIRSIPDEFSELSDNPSLEQIKEGLTAHPLIKMEDSTLLASEKKISEVEQQYKPGFSVDVSYGARRGRGFDGSSLPDMFSAMLFVDLPIFTDKRQDRQLAAAKKQNLAMQFTRADRLLELASLTEREYANWQRLGDRLSL